MGLFGFFKSKETTSAYSAPEKSVYFPKAQNTQGIRNEEELKERAKIILNDTDGIIILEDKAKAKMSAYKKGTAFPLDFTPVISTEGGDLTFFGYRDWTNHIVVMTDISQLNLNNIKEVSVKQSFFPTETTPHFVGKIGVNDSALEKDGSLNPLGFDVNFDMSSLGMRIILYELIVFPDCCIYFVDEKYKGQEEFRYHSYKFKNSFAARANFLCEVEAYIHSLSNYSIFSFDKDSATELYQKCFHVNGKAVEKEAIDCWKRRLKISPAPASAQEWIEFTV